MNRQCDLPLNALVLPILLVSIAGCGRPAGAEAEVSYSYSRDPKAVVLYVAATGFQRDLTDSVMIFGDGRAEANRKLGARHERFEFVLEPGELDKLLDMMIAHGLAVYDDTRIYAEQKRSTGQVETSVEDGEYVEVTLALTSFRRGDWSVENLRKSIKFMAPDVGARRFPAIEEFAGLSELARFAHEAFLRPGGVRK